MQKIKAVIFDLDGTLANTLPLCIAAFKKAIEPLVNHQISDEEIIATFGPSEEGTIWALAPNNFDKGVSDYLAFYKDLHSLCPEPFDGLLEILTELRNKNIHLSMVTGKGNLSAAISLEKFGLTHFFKYVETGIKEGPSKPEGIQHILNKLKDIAKDEVVYIGDAPSDITACRKVGIPIVAAAWAETAEAEKLIALKPNELFYSIADFKDWLYPKIN
ncbi:MAG: HAD family hydrolase [Pedobacter sp.]|nr:MAG: HAD family hydrolase [Pedobacter sp.]